MMTFKSRIQCQNFELISDYFFLFQCFVRGYDHRQPPANLYLHAEPTSGTGTGQMLPTGLNPIKLFKNVIYQFTSKARVFVLVKCFPAQSDVSRFKHSTCNTQKEHSRCLLVRTAAYSRVEHLKDATLEQALALPSSIRLGWKGLPCKNTLAYYKNYLFFFTQARCLPDSSLIYKYYTRLESFGCEKTLQLITKIRKLRTKSFIIMSSGHRYANEHGCILW